MFFGDIRLWGILFAMIVAGLVVAVVAKMFVGYDDSEGGPPPA